MPWILLTRVVKNVPMPFIKASATPMPTATTAPLLLVEGLDARQALALASDLLAGPKALNCAQPLATANAAFARQAHASRSGAASRSYLPRLSRGGPGPAERSAGPWLSVAL
jgi:hypothetical protein